MSKYQIPGYQSNPNDTLHKRGRDAPNVPLHEIQKQLLEYLGTNKDVRKAKEKIEEKYSIKNGLWSVSHIKKAWGKTQRMDWLHKKKRKYWSIVIIMQMLQQSNINIPLQQHHPDRSTKSKKRPNSKENTSQNSDPKKPKYHNCKQNDKNTKIKNGSEGILIPLFMFQNTEQPLAMENTDHISRIKLLNGEPTCQNTQVVPTRYQLLNKTSHVVQYDNETNNAAWVFEILNKETIDGPATVQSEYRLDYLTHRDHRAPESLKKYTGTGFQKGHLAAAANHKWCQKARDDTNLLSNIAPQHEDLNQRKWKDLENLCRLYVQDDYSKAYIYTGPLYCIEKYIFDKGITEKDNIKKEKEKIESSMRYFMSKYGKALPTHFFKVIILEKDNGERDLKCYEMPNKIEGEEEQEEQQREEQQREEQQREEQRRRQREEEPRQRRRHQIKCFENKLFRNSRYIDYIERVSGLRFTEEIPENLRNRKVVVTVEFKTEEEQKNIPNVDITPRHYVRSEM